MRQWMLDPRILCQKHLCGEHVETHMFLGSFKKKISIDGYIKNNCTEPEAVSSRHDALVKEMLDRGYNHKSPISEEELQESLEYLGDKRYVKVDKKSSLEDLLKRCPECRARHQVFYPKKAQVVLE
jgi:hypothetical protein